MKRKDLSPLTVSLHGMNKRMLKMIQNYLKLTCKGIAIVVEDDEAQAEIVDVDFPGAKLLLKERLERQPSKPIIAISLHKVSSSKVIYIKKPFIVSEFKNAISTAKDIVRNKSTLKNPIDLNTLPNTSKPKSKSESKSKVDPSKDNIPPTIKKQGGFDKVSATSTSNSNKNTILEKTSKLIDQTPIIDDIPHIRTISPNQRQAIRYRFEGVEGFLKKKSLLASNNLLVQVLNISSKGALIQCNKQLKLRSNVELELKFSPQRCFNVAAQVIRKQDKKSYGLFFEKHHHDLIDFLINSIGEYNMVLTET